MANNEKKKGGSYISAKASRQISKFNRKLTRKLEKERKMPVRIPHCIQLQ